MTRRLKLARACASRAGLRFRRHVNPSDSAARIRSEPGVGMNLSRVDFYFLGCTLGRAVAVSCSSLVFTTSCFRVGR